MAWRDCHHGVLPPVPAPPAFGLGASVALGSVDAGNTVPTPSLLVTPVPVLPITDVAGAGESSSQPVTTRSAMRTWQNLNLDEREAELNGGMC